MKKNKAKKKKKKKHTETKNVRFSETMMQL